MCVAVDGNVAGPDISPETPLGRDGECLQEWMFAGRTSAESQHFETDHFRGIGALILGRRMADLGIGLSGDEPTFHASCFIVTPPSCSTIVKAGRHVVHLRPRRDREPLQRAQEAADSQDVPVRQTWRSSAR
jgi:hypothetical protein